MDAVGRTGTAPKGQIGLDLDSDLLPTIPEGDHMHKKASGMISRARIGRARFGLTKAMIHVRPATLEWIQKMSTRPGMTHGKSDMPRSTEKKLNKLGMIDNEDGLDNDVMTIQLKKLRQAVDRNADGINVHLLKKALLTAHF